MEFRFRIKRSYRFECYDGDVLRWVVEIENLIPDEGLSYAITALIGEAPVYLGLIDAAGFSALATTDTAAEIGGTNGWTEIVAYTPTARPLLIFGGISPGVVSNLANPAIYTATAPFEFYGGFLVTSSTLSGTNGTILGEAAADAGSQSVLAGNMISAVATMTIVSD